MQPFFRFKKNYLTKNYPDWFRKIGTFLAKKDKPGKIFGHLYSLGHHQFFLPIFLVYRFRFSTMGVFVICSSRIVICFSIWSSIGRFYQDLQRLFFLSFSDKFIVLCFFSATKKTMDEFPGHGAICVYRQRRIRNFVKGFGIITAEIGSSFAAIKKWIFADEKMNLVTFLKNESMKLVNTCWLYKKAPTELIGKHLFVPQCFHFNLQHQFTLKFFCNCKY